MIDTIELDPKDHVERLLLAGLRVEVQDPCSRKWHHVVLNSFGEIVFHWSPDAVVTGWDTFGRDWRVVA